MYPARKPCSEHNLIISDFCLRIRRKKVGCLFKVDGILQGVDAVDFSGFSKCGGKSKRCNGADRIWPGLDGRNDVLRAAKADKKLAVFHVKSFK